MQKCRPPYGPENEEAIPFEMACSILIIAPDEGLAIQLWLANFNYMMLPVTVDYKVKS